jgi:hypothetical protein
MIYPLSGLLIGVLIGGARAKIRGGKTLDLLQWGAVFGIIGAMFGLFVLIYLERQYA